MKKRETALSPDESLKTEIDRLVDRSRRPLDEIVAVSLRILIARNTALSKLLQYCLDVAGDQFIGEELYQRYPFLLDFLARSGCDNEEVLFQSWVKEHPAVFRCKTYNCHGTIRGGCPKMYCDNCGRQYFLEIDHISASLCSRCVAETIGECSPESRTRCYRIYAVRG